MSEVEDLRAEVKRLRQIAYPVAGPHIEGRFRAWVRDPGHGHPPLHDWKTYPEGPGKKEKQ